MNKKCNIVFEGGGIKGIGLVGAVQGLYGSGCRFNGIAGTSAGAIVASLLAAGYTPSEMKDVLKSVNYAKFKQKTLIDYLGLPGRAISVLKNYGIYSTDYFESWLASLLAAKGVSVFGDIKNERGSCQRYKFQAVASDITAHKLLILPDDLEQFGIDIDSFKVAAAVKMSMSIPIFFEPVKIKDKRGKQHIIADGGILSNYPLWLFDNDKTCRDTLGVRFSLDTKEIIRAVSTEGVGNFFDYLKYIVDTMIEAHDKQHIKTSNGDFTKTVFVSPTIHIDSERKDIKSTYFDITDCESEALYQNGLVAANRFLNR